MQAVLTHFWCPIPLDTDAMLQLRFLPIHKHGQKISTFTHPPSVAVGAQVVLTDNFLGRQGGVKGMPCISAKPLDNDSCTITPEEASVYSEPCFFMGCFFFHALFCVTQKTQAKNNKNKVRWSPHACEV